VTQYDCQKFSKLVKPVVLLISTSWTYWALRNVRKTFRSLSRPHQTDSHAAGFCLCRDISCFACVSLRLTQQSVLRSVASVLLYTVGLEMSAKCRVQGVVLSHRKTSNLFTYSTDYGPDGLGIESRWGRVFRTCPDRPWGPPCLLYNGYRVFPGGRKRPGRDADPSPLLVPRLKKLYLYSP
jgi:hypothetical protein